VSIQSRVRVVLAEVVADPLSVNLRQARRLLARLVFERA